MTPCFRCGSQPVFEAQSWWLLYCPNCYDGATDSTSRSEVASGPTVEAAEKDWNERNEEKRLEHS